MMVPTPFFCYIDIGPISVVIINLADSQIIYFIFKTPVRMPSSKSIKQYFRNSFIPTLIRKLLHDTFLMKFILIRQSDIIIRLINFFPELLIFFTAIWCSRYQLSTINF